MSECARAFEAQVASRLVNHTIWGISCVSNEACGRKVGRCGPGGASRERHRAVLGRPGSLPSSASHRGTGARPGGARGPGCTMRRGANPASRRAGRFVRDRTDRGNVPHGRTDRPWSGPARPRRDPPCPDEAGRRWAAEADGLDTGEGLMNFGPEAARQRMLVREEGSGARHGRIGRASGPPWRWSP